MSENTHNYLGLYTNFVKNAINNHENRHNTTPNENQNPKNHPSNPYRILRILVQNNPAKTTTSPRLESSTWSSQEKLVITITVTSFK